MRDAVLQGHAIQKFHRDEGLTFIVADLVNGADVWMVQSRGGAGFAAKTLQRLRVLGKIVGKKFQRDKSPELGIFGLVNDTHASAAKFLDNAVVRNGFVDHNAEAKLWSAILGT